MKGNDIRRVVSGITLIEWGIIACVVLILTAVVVGGRVRSRECADLLAGARTYRDSMDVRIACNVRTGGRRAY